MDKEGFTLSPTRTQILQQRLANFLTLARIGFIPVLTGLMYLEASWASYAALGVFLLAALTDWLDGYVARIWSSYSDFGRFLDPIADKLLVATVLMVLVAQQRLTGWSVVAAIIIMCREILVSGLREYLAGLRIGVPVSRLAKWKTALQFVALAILIFAHSVPKSELWSALGTIGLGIAAALTLVTGYDYLRAGLRHMDWENAGSPPNQAQATHALPHHPDRPL
ncbi:MAG: CDP-diacylglycerol--glycerol-3-phosphate 3-phosphatidyltransferase [Candidatus Symbiobacter sp.]|nr:CDP-diacylglycerol--glycerol-3-phosphate 3-phosphatidyltransferase [Candidatus Symbiobacter sp.]